MNKIYCFLILMIFAAALGGCRGGESGAPQCGKTFGGMIDDYGAAAQQTDDGGYIVAGTKSLGAASGKMWALKLDAAGELEWEESFGADGRIETAASVKQTIDSGYIIAGTSESIADGQKDVRVIRLDPTGMETWSATYGNSGLNESVRDIDVLFEGGYVLTGSATTGGGPENMWVFRLRADGELLWDKMLRSPNREIANSVRQTTDGGYIIAGTVFTSENMPKNARVVKLDAAGNMQWQQVFGNDKDLANCVEQTADGGFIVAGHEIIKLDPAGKPEWIKTYAGIAYGIQQTADGGYVVAENSVFWGPGAADWLILKLNSKGEKVWAEAYGGKADDIPRSIRRTAGGGFIATGYTESFGAAGADLWVMKLDARGRCEW